MTRRLEAAMREHFAQFRLQRYSGKRSPWVFHHEYMKRGGARPGTRIKCMRKGLTASATDAKLPAGWVPHDLRHRRVTSWLGQGKSPVLVQEAAGHAEITTTMRYAHLAREHLRALVERPEPTHEATEDAG